MFTTPIGVKPTLLRFLPALLIVAIAAVPVHATKAPETIAVLDSLIEDVTITPGDVVYVDFWASWCVPCRQSFPWMSGLLEKYGKQGLKVVTINVDRDHAAAEKFLKDTHSTLPVVYDPKGKLPKLWDLQVMPTSFVYGRDGTLRRRNEGFIPEEAASVEKLIRELLEEKPKK